MKKRPANLRLWTMLLALPLATLLGGCYHHVVRVQGPGAANYSVYESNLGNDGGLYGSIEEDEPMAPPGYRIPK